MNKTKLPRFAILAASLLFTISVVAQQRAVLTSADYARAEKLMGYNTAPLVSRSGVRPNWTPDDRFWYRITTADGSEFLRVDPSKGTREPAFDHAKVAAALSEVAGATYDARHLPFTQFDFSPDGQTISFTVRQRRWKCDLQANKCAAEAGADPGAAAPGGRARALEVVSPDKKRAAFIRDFNLWVRDVASAKETQVTADGVKDFGYATDNAGWVHSDRAILLWSPDSKKIATFQQDQRKVGEMYVVETKVGHPTLQAWKYPLPGDAVVAMIQRVVIDVDQPGVVRLKMPPDQHRSTVCDNIACRGTELADAEWSPDSSELAFVSVSRDHKEANLRIADLTGAVRDVLDEKVKTHFESGQNQWNWRYLSASHEVIWFSERDNWGHLYLYDSTNGRLKNQITKGDWAVTDVLRVDEKNRLLYFLAVGREPGRNSYFKHLYRIGFDGTKLTLLTVDGRRPGVAIGMTGPEMAAEMVRLGCFEAINLDGGGSTTLVMREPSDKELRTVNHPSDARERPVADVIGVSVK